MENFHNLQRRIDELEHLAGLAEREGDLERVAQIRYGELPTAQKEYQSFEKRYFSKNQGKFIKEYVDAENVAAVVSRWTGIPVNRMLESELAKLSGLKKCFQR